jgi:protein-S-isoprenylcysteine O-methyltransferase Ste14
MVHPFAGFWRRRKYSPYRILIPAWVGMWILFAFVSSPWRHVVLYHSAWPRIPALTFFALGIGIYRASGNSFRIAQLSGLPELLPNKREEKLVISSIRSRVRHPIYLGHLCEMIAWSVGTGLVVCYGLTLLAIVAGAFMIRFEDRELEQRFGQEYREYRRRVPAVVPRFENMHL